MGMGMRLVWAGIAGAVIGFLMCAFVFYPPHSGWAKDTDSAAWLGAISSMLGAVATFTAAVIALFVARLPVVQQERFQLAKAQVLVQGLADELIHALAVAQSVSGLLDGMRESRDLGRLVMVGSVAQQIESESMERSLPALDCFGPRFGEAIARGIYGALNLRKMGKVISGLEENSPNRGLVGDGFVPFHVRGASAACNRSLASIQGALDALTEYVRANQAS